MQDNERARVLKQMLMDHESNFGFQQWHEARLSPTKWTVDAVVRSLSQWDDRLQEHTHSYEVFLDRELRDAVCERLGREYESLTEDLPEADSSLQSAVAIFIGMAVVIVIGWIVS